jgi:N-acetyl-D-muramate 6-phosphate phosphatase
MPINLKRIHAICFDVDGTLSDTDDVMQNRLVPFFNPFRFMIPEGDARLAARRLLMAFEAPGNFLISLPDRLGLDDTLYGAYDWFARHQRNKPGKFLLIPGVKEMLADLAGRFPLAVVSARDERTTRSFLEQFDLLSYFQCIATAQTCRHTKPFPDPVLWAAEKMAVPVENCLMVGDTTVDIRAGREAGAQTVGVLCGFGEENELRKRGADMILQGTAELAQVLAAE